jgi:hypothetical protein
MSRALRTAGARVLPKAGHGSRVVFAKWLQRFARKRPAIPFSRWREKVPKADEDGAFGHIRQSVASSLHGSAFQCFARLSTSIARIVQRSSDGNGRQVQPFRKHFIGATNRTGVRSRPDREREILAYATAYPQEMPMANCCASAEVDLPTREIPRREHRRLRP